MNESKMRNSTDESVANPGLVRPPFVYLLAVVVGLLIEASFPLRFTLGFFGWPLAILAFGCGVALFLCTRHEFHRVKTPIPGNLPVTELITQGPFKRTRNPMYLAFSLFHLSIAIWSQSFWMIITLGIAIIVMSVFVIPREEKYMLNKFGPEFAAYKLMTRRWI